MVGYECVLRVGVLRRGVARVVAVEPVLCQVVVMVGLVGGEVELGRGVVGSKEMFRECVRLRRRRRKSPRAMRARRATPPTAMPAMAPVESKGFEVSAVMSGMADLVSCASAATVGVLEGVFSAFLLEVALWLLLLFDAVFVAVCVDVGFSSSLSAISIARAQLLFRSSWKSAFALSPTPQPLSTQLLILS